MMKDAFLLEYMKKDPDGCILYCIQKTHNHFMLLKNGEKCLKSCLAYVCWLCLWWLFGVIAGFNFVSWCSLLMSTMKFFMMCDCF
jgi:hypothetical protein